MGIPHTHFKTTKFFQFFAFKTCNKQINKANALFRVLWKFKNGIENVSLKSFSKETSGFQNGDDRKSPTTISIITLLVIEQLLNIIIGRNITFKLCFRYWFFSLQSTKLFLSKAIFLRLSGSWIEEQYLLFHFMQQLYHLQCLLFMLRASFRGILE